MTSTMHLSGNSICSATILSVMDLASILKSANEAFRSIRIQKPQLENLVPFGEMITFEYSLSKVHEGRQLNLAVNLKLNGPDSDCTGTLKSPRNVYLVEVRKSSPTND
jgi:hypothetical protein